VQIQDLLNQCHINDSTLDAFKSCHPKQIISDYIPVPIWSFLYNSSIGNSEKEG
jgi:hypothetical protein